LNSYSGEIVDESAINTATHIILSGTNNEIKEKISDDCKKVTENDIWNSIKSKKFVK
jgi:hypothetical protein